MGTVLKRIKEIAQQEGISLTALETVIGASKGVLSRALANGTDIQSKWLVRITENYPHYSPDWLLTGHGTMRSGDATPDAAVLRDSAEGYLAEKPKSPNDELIHALKQVIATQDTAIQSQAVTIATLQKRVAELEDR